MLNLGVRPMCLVIWDGLRDRRKEVNKLRGAQMLMLRAEEVVESVMVSVAESQM